MSSNLPGIDQENYADRWRRILEAADLGSDVESTILQLIEVSKRDLSDPIREAFVLAAECLFFGERVEALEAVEIAGEALTKIAPPKSETERLREEIETLREEIEG